MKEQKAPCAVREPAVTVVQISDRLARRDEERLILGSRFLRGVRPVRQQREAEPAVGVREVMHLEAFGELAHLRFARQERGDDDERVELLRDAPRELELGEAARTDEFGYVPVDDCHGDVRRGDEREESEEGELPAGSSRGIGKGERQGEEGGRGDEDRADVSRRRGCEVRAPKPLGERHAVAYLLLERLTTARNQVVARVRFPLFRRIRAGGILPLSSPFCGAPRDLDLREGTSPGEILDRVPVSIASSEVHLRDASAGSQGLLDETDGLEEVRPVHRGDQAHAGNHVTDGHVRGDLLLMLAPHDVVRGRALLLDPVRQPHQGGCLLGVALPQALEKVDRERNRQRLAFEGSKPCCERFRRP